MSIRFPDSTLFYDIETHSVTERLDHTPRDYFRLGGYAWGESEEIHITDDYDEMLYMIRAAPISVAHNLHNFDHCVMFGYDSTEALELALDGRTFDTLIHATLCHPSPYKYTNKDGVEVLGKTPAQARKWFSLDNQAFQLGVPGKLMALDKLAHKYEFEYFDVVGKSGKVLKTPGKRKVEGLCCGYGNIPLDDPEFREYLEHDVRALRHVARKLLEMRPLDAYSIRAQKNAAIDAQLHRNGIRVNRDLVRSRILDQDWDVAHALNELHTNFEMPMSGKKPLGSNAGKEALALALKASGVKLRDLQRTATGAHSFGGDSVKEACAKAGNPEAEKLGDAVASLAGARTLAQLTDASTRSDGRVHPEYMPLQLSGRKSITNPGLTVFDSAHKDYYVPEPGYVFLEFDLSNSDARGVAAMSGDREYARRFEPGQDGHMLNAIAAWGAELVATDPKGFRQKAKIPGHGWNYGGRAKALAAQSGSPLEEMEVFVQGMDSTFVGVVEWQGRIRDYARRHGYVENLWGRRMFVDPKRLWTQAPALMGQSWTTELMTDFLLRCTVDEIRMIRLTIHDAVLVEVPEDEVEYWRERFTKLMYSEHSPPGGQFIQVPVSSGPAGYSWRDAEHG